MNSDRGLVVRRPRTLGALGTLGTLAFALGLALLGACEDEGDGRVHVPTGRLPKATSAYRRAPCLFPAPITYATECGFVTVPESPGSATTIEIAVARFFVRNGTVAPDPLVMLTGGPGQGATQLAAKAYSSLKPLIGPRDLIAIDQRGTGSSKPSLNCPELTDPLYASSLLDALTACRARLVASGWDPAAYGTANNAADVAAVRVALGYPAWNLFGVSYGTRLALTVLRDHPEGIRSVVLSSIVPLEVDLLGEVAANGERAFTRLFASCAADPGCDAAHPELESRFRTLVAELDASPLSIPVAGRIASISGADVLDLVFELLYDASSIPYLPQLLEATIAGDEGPLTDIIGQLVGGAGISYGMHLSAQCAEELPFTDLGTAAPDVDPLYRDVLVPYGYEAECAAWGVPAAETRENQAVMSDVPTLVVSGGFDPITPPSYGALVAASLANATNVVFENAAHSTGTSDACSQSVIAGFLDDIALGSEETSCIATAFPLSYRRNHARFIDEPIPDETLRAIADRLRELPRRVRRERFE